MPAKIAFLDAGLSGTPVVNAFKQRVEDVFSKAVEIATPAARTAYLRRACGDDTALIEAVERLLKAHERAGEFLQSPPSVDPGEFGWSDCVLPKTEKVGDLIDRYRLVEQLGEGGFGVVWLAEQLEPVHRKVALKVIKAGMDTRQGIARFEAERQALALMDHPNIARVFDGGTTELGRLYFVMELVRGVPITSYCDAHQLSVEARLRLFIQVCQAVQHAHLKGVIHRDLKPSNILVIEHGGIPVPKVIDFGVAKAIEGRLTDKTLVSDCRHLLGTPCYMSPEQAGLGDLDVDTRSDVYSLGVALYVLLTGCTPFDCGQLLAAGLDEMRRIIREKDPPRPSTRVRESATTSDLNSNCATPAELVATRTATASSAREKRAELLRTLNADLDWVVMKCLEKDRSRRYETAHSLAADLQRYLDHEPVIACPPGRAYRLKKLVRRNRSACIAAAAVLAALSAGLTCSLYLLDRESRAHHRAVTAERAAEARLRQACLAQAQVNRFSGRSGQRFASLEALHHAAALRPGLDLRNEAIACLASYDMRVARRLPGASPTAALNSRSGIYARVDQAGNISVLRLDDDSEVTALPGFGRRGLFLRFSPDGKYLAAKYDVQPKPDPSRANVLLIWDVEHSSVVYGATNKLFEVALDFHPHEALVAVGTSDAIIDVCELPSGRLRQSCSVGVRPFMLRFNPAGDLLATSSMERSVVVLLEWVPGKVLHKLPHPGRAFGEHEVGTFGLAWHPHGRILACGASDNGIYLWEAGSGKSIGVLKAHQGAPVQLAFSPDGELLVSTGWDATCFLWHTTHHERLMQIPGKGSCLEFDSSGGRLGFLAEGTTLALLEVAGHPAARMLSIAPKAECSEGAFTPDGRLLVLTAADGTLFWDVYGGREAGRFRQEWCRSVQFAQDASHFILTAKNVLQRWRIASIESPEPLVRIGPFARYDVPVGAENATFIPGTHRAVIGGSGHVVAIDLDQPADRIHFSGHTAAQFVSANPSGRWIATGSWPEGGAVVWEAQTGKREHTFPIRGGACVRFSPDGQWLVIGAENEYLLFRSGNWQLVRRFPGDPVVYFKPFQFSPDGRLLAIRKSSAEIQLLCPADGEEVARLPGAQPFPLCFSPDGTKLVVAEQRGKVRLWDLRLLRHSLADLNLDWDQPRYPPAADTPSVPLCVEVVTQ